MGNSSWSDQTYQSVRSSYSGKSQQQVFTSKGLDPLMDPNGIKFRESRDSVEHPNSLAVAVFLDETGSMGDIPEYLIKNKLGTLMNTLITHGLKDAHVLFGGVGDHLCDRAPLQAGQFEAGTTELDTWLTKIYLEGNGGGNGGESYLMPWLFAARHTSIDCFEKRDEKGFLFTIGDEWCHPELEADAQKRFLGYGETSVTKEQLLAEAQRTYHVFHLYVETGYNLLKRWKDFMKENVIEVTDKDAIAEIIASTVAVVHGVDLKNVVKDFDSHTASVVSKALVNVSKDLTRQDKGIMVL